MITAWGRHPRHEGHAVVPVLADAVRRRAGPGARARARAPRARASTPASSRRATARRPNPASPPSGRAPGCRATASVAPIASGRAVARRTIEALRTFQPDVAAPPRAAVARAEPRRAGRHHHPRRRHVPLGPRRAQRLVRDLPARAAADDAPPGGVDRGVGGRPAPGHPDLRRRLRDPAQRRRRRRASPPVRVTPSPRAGDPVRRPPRAAQGPGGAARRVRRARARRRPLGDRRRPAPGRRCAAAACPGSSGSDGSPRRRSRRASAGATIACFPALDGESFGVVLLEAMAAGTAVVASDIDGYRTVSRGRPRGACWSRPATPTPCAAALRALLDDPARRADAGRRRPAAGPTSSP